MAIPFSVPSLSLKGRVAVVTGGGTGIGREISIEFAKAGADLVVAARGTSNLEKVAEEISAMGRRCLPVQADVTRKTDVDEMVDTVVNAFGRLDILVNNAGIGSGVGANGRGLGHRDPPWLLDLPEDNWDPIIATHLKGLYLCCAAAGRQMVEQKNGNIIVISSAGGVRGLARAYSAAKAGQIRLATGLAKELGPYNIRVNCIAPGLVRTPVGVVQRPSDAERYDEEKIWKDVPLGRVAEALDIATVALFFASDASNYVTGQTITMTGGPIP